MLILLDNPRVAPAYTHVLQDKLPMLKGYLRKRLNIVVGNLIRRVSGPGACGTFSQFAVIQEYGRA